MQYKFELHGIDDRGFTHVIMDSCSVIGENVSESAAVEEIFQTAITSAAFELIKAETEGRFRIRYYLYAIYRVAGKGMAQEAVLIWKEIKHEIKIL